MPTWEVRKVSGKSFIEDTAIAAYQDLDDSAIPDLEALHQPAYIGELEQFVDLPGLANAAESPEEAVASLQTCWNGEPLEPGTVYCVVVEWETDPTAPSKSSARALVEDRMVQAAKNQFSQARHQPASGSSSGAVPRPQSTSRSLRQKGRLRT